MARIEVKRIGDICTNVYSGGTPLTSNASFYDGDIPWLNTNEVDFTNIYKTNRTISQEGLRNSAAKFVPVNTVIVAMYGVTAGKSAIAKIPLTTNQACCNLVIDETQADYAYVFYYLKSQSHELNKLANGGAQQNLNTLLIKKYKIPLPPLTIQKNIAQILSAYDDLIAVNNKRIKVLEQMAENLYKEWFVRFRFPGHENATFENGIPKGWNKKKISEVVNFFNGFAFKSEEYDDEGRYIVITIKNVQDGKMDISNVERICAIPNGMPDYCMLSKGDILMSLTGNVGRVCIVSEENCVLNQRVCTIKSKFPYYSYLFFKQEIIFQTLCNIAYGTAQLNLSPILAGKIKVFFPPEKIMKQFNNTVLSYYDMIQKLKEQNKILIKQRDLLLPRLMSGKLEVK